MPEPENLEQMWVYPSKRTLVVRDPESMRQLPVGGKMVDQTTYWMRRLKVGDVKTVIAIQLPVWPEVVPAGLVYDDDPPAPIPEPVSEEIPTPAPEVPEQAEPSDPAPAPAPVEGE